MSLVLDMSSLSNTEPILSVSTPRDVTLQLLNTASHVLSQRFLQQQTWSLEEIQEEFAVRYFQFPYLDFIPSEIPPVAYNPSIKANV